MIPDDMASRWLNERDNVNDNNSVTQLNPGNHHIKVS